MTNARGKDVDTTSLSLNQAANRGWVHRDYLAHVFRWQHVLKRVRSPKFKDMHILDVGCGVEAPLPTTLFSNQLSHNKGKGSYIGVDYCKKIEPDHYVMNAVEKGSFKGTFLPGFDFAKDALPRDNFDLITCFEVLEHVEPYHAFKMLQRMFDLATGEVILSTPVYDERVGPADNHVAEHSYDSFRGLIEASGLQVVEHYGTFASQKDYKTHMSPGQAEVFKQLRDYYDSNVVANIMAPIMEPTMARNVIWICRADQHPLVDRAMRLKECIASKRPTWHCNSDKWEAHLRKIIKECNK